MTNSKKYTLPSSYKNNSGKTSVFTPFRGSITVEAALAFPFFFFAVLALIFLFEMMAIQTSVRDGLQYAGRGIVQDAYPLAVADPGKIEEYIVKAIGAERMERSLIKGGSSGIDCSDSYMSMRTGVGKLSVKYQIEIPVPMFFIKNIQKKDSIRIKAWTGYEKEFLQLFDDETVYVTDTGLVYHRNYHCTYLDLSIHMVTAGDISTMRNKNGEKYHACLMCAGRGNEKIYVTDTGNKYHSSLSCSGLKRTVYAVPLSEVIGKGACVRCGK